LKCTQHITNGFTRRGNPLWLPIVDIGCIVIVWGEGSLGATKSFIGGNKIIHWGQPQGLPLRFAKWRENDWA